MTGTNKHSKRAQRDEPGQFGVRLADEPVAFVDEVLAVAQVSGQPDGQPHQWQGSVADGDPRDRQRIGRVGLAQARRT